MAAISDTTSSSGSNSSGGRSSNTVSTNMSWIEREGERAGRVVSRLESLMISGPQPLVRTPLKAGPCPGLPRTLLGIVPYSSPSPLGLAI